METDETSSAVVISMAAEERGGLLRHVAADRDSLILKRDAPRAAAAQAASDLWNKGRLPAAPPSQPAPVGAPTDSEIVGSSPAARLLREKIRLYAEEREPVLVTGETGTGKELVARELHRLSGRSEEKFIPVNIGGVPEGLASSELFGHVKGAFTGAVSEFEGAFSAAHLGSLFLDEIGDMPHSVQVQLLRVLDDGVVRKLGARAGLSSQFRLVTATNVDLESAVAEGRFRRDLFHRISVLVIHTPPLRERGDDVVELADHFIRDHPRQAYRGAKLTPNAADRLRALPFHGNIRELRNKISAAVVHARGGKILAEHLPEPDATTSVGGALEIDEARNMVDRLIILKAMRLAGGNVSKAAEITGRSRSTIHAMLQQIGGGDLNAAYDAARTRLRSYLD